MDYSDVMDEPRLMRMRRTLARQMLKAYTNGEIGEIYLAYTHFKNTVSHDAEADQASSSGVR